MELKRRLDARVAFVVVSWAVTIMYLLVGLMPAEAKQYSIAGKLEIPSIGISSDVTKLEMEALRLETPERIVGSYSRSENKTLLIGHSTTAFFGLDGLRLGAAVYYNGEMFRVVQVDLLKKEMISMNKVLDEEEVPTLVLMTCAGELLSGGDATHRLIVTATKR